MDITVWVIGGIVVVAALYPVVWLLVRSYRNARGTRVITCPQNRKPAAVKVDAVRVAVSRLFGRTSFRISDCSRWPEWAGCGQGCAQQIEAAPSECLLRVMLQNWYADKPCACCGKPMQHFTRLGHAPVLRTPEGKTLECYELPAEDIPAALATHQPVCWDCHITQAFRRLDPDLVSERVGSAKHVEASQSFKAR